MNCLICGADTEKYHDKQFEIDYHSCPSCEFIFQDRLKLITHEEERDEYDRHENSIENEGYVTYFKRFVDSAVVPFVEGDRGLDFGSGPEPVLSQVLSRDYGMTVDIYDLHYQPKKIYEGKSYDYIISTEVIEHVDNPKEVFHLFHRLLERGGKLSMMTLFHPNDKEKFLKWWYRRDITHISFFTLKTLTVLGNLTGFDVIYTDNNRYITFSKR